MTKAHAARGGCFLLLLPLVRASWWLLGMPAAYQTSLELKPTTYQTYCRKLQYLVERQRELCGMNPNILQTVGRGAKMGIDECQHQFRMSRWNCTTFSNSSTVFGGVMDVRSSDLIYEQPGGPGKVICEEILWMCAGATLLSFGMETKALLSGSVPGDTVPCSPSKLFSLR
ncbi:protein Wnt [Trichonephila clavata]|uniref:Protein Wnt n=1 Tax=Trichonephila clavata TaxID=2740835 RepID=A0A8X6GFY2_TRICU|nr:protein Wnt [Trichonephila clavata]